MPYQYTTKGIPYPQDSDPLGQGAYAMSRLAKTVDAMVQAGTVLLTITAANSAVSANVTFPVAFATPPVVVCSFQAANSNAITIVCSATSVTTTGCVIWGFRGQGTTNLTVAWIAVGKPPVIS